MMRPGGCWPVSVGRVVNVEGNRSIEKRERERERKSACESERGRERKRVSKVSILYLRGSFRR